MTTFAELTSVFPRPRGPRGESFAAALQGKDLRTKPRLMYWENHEGGFGQAVRLGQWKGLRQAGEKALRLYDLEADPAEADDVAADHPDVVKQLTRPAK